jgi:hypothetical protein
MKIFYFYFLVKCPYNKTKGPKILNYKIIFDDFIKVTQSIKDCWNFVLYIKKKNIEIIASNEDFTYPIYLFIYLFCPKEIGSH